MPEFEASSSTNIGTPSWIVGVGASAGGLEPIEMFFDQMPTDTGMAFVIVQHLSPDFKSLMSELLARHTKMKINPVVDGMQVLANQVYLIPPRMNMVLRGGKLRLEEQTHDGTLNLPIDIFFRSLAEDARANAISVVLSGTGSDGSRGLQHVHESGGLVLVQSLATAGFDGMPKSAKATGMVDVVTSPSMMPERILSFIKDPEKFKRGVEDEDQLKIDDDAIGQLFRLFRRQYGIDFSRYRPTTIHRRIDRRIQMSSVSTLDQYIEVIESDPKELGALYRDLLVEVTQFFRDPEAFQKIKTDVIPGLLRDCEPNGQLRFWVPACATGEEAYSLAILVHDAMSRMPSRENIDVKIFATDVHQASLETASAGVYSIDSLKSVPHDLREKYFSRSKNLLHVVSAIRQMVIFAPHDITSDPPFTKLDLISCRNVLIYLNPDVQQKVVSLFHFGLRVGGCLFLGPSESLGDAEGEFDVVDSNWRIFSKSRDVRLAPAVTHSYSQPLRQIVRRRPTFLSNATQTNSNPLIPDVHEMLLRDYVPPSLLVGEFGDLIHCFGEARTLLSQPEGRATLDVLRLVDGDLRMALSTALQRGRNSTETVVMKAVPVVIAGQKRMLRIIVRPYQKGEEKMHLICLEDEPDGSRVPIQPEGECYDVSNETTERLINLERELAYSKESLQSTVEQLETSNEELQSTNEELVASNEELQSTNEELHSVNEELHTVNTEHQIKIAELTEMTTDMDNLLQSTEIGTIFLDETLCIRKFTPAIGEAFYVLEQDVGRPIEHIASNLEIHNLPELVRGVLENGEPIEREARNRDGKVHLLRIQPYLNDDRSRSGVVLTCVDVSAILASYEEIRRFAETIEMTDRDLQEFAYAVSHDLQAPLRHVSNRLQLLREKYQEDEDLESVDLFMTTSNCVGKLESMLVGLLRYARIYSFGKPFVSSDLTELVELAKVEVKSLLDDSGTIVECGTLPTLNVDPIQIQSVFSQLIVNAISFAREMPPRITLSAKRVEHHWQFDVSDNGIGIAPHHRERVFVIFERLEFRSIPGEGLGLPMCKRILQRHGGNISVLDGPDGRGTTVRFNLPLNEGDRS